jgi:hypothetical protein
LANKAHAGQAAEEKFDKDVTSRLKIITTSSTFSPSRISTLATGFPLAKMRLRLTVKRHALPDTPVVWNVDPVSSTISQLLEQINEAIPIQSDGQWGLEDYAVELKGNNGVNFECLHYQAVGKVFKEDDEVMHVYLRHCNEIGLTRYLSIRPLLTQDLKIRRISGRHQISADGKHLMDGLAFGRPLLRRPIDRPPIAIPPRKRPRITYNEDEDDDEGLLALKEKESSENEYSEHDENGNRQLVLHADFEDDDSEDDEDFAPGEDDDETEEDHDEDIEQVESDEDEDMDNEEVKTPIPASQDAEEESNEKALRDINDEHARAMIRKLHSAFPKSPIAVCKYVLSGSDGDLGEAYEAMARGFLPVKSKSSITELSQDNLPVEKKRSKKRKAVAEEPEDHDSMQVEMDDSIDPIVEHYDQNGLPRGSITSGKALSHMAEVMTEALKSSPVQAPLTSKRKRTQMAEIMTEALQEVLQSSPSRATPNAGVSVTSKRASSQQAGSLQTSPSRARRGSRGSITSNKSVRFALDDVLTKGRTSTPFIDRSSQLVESGKEVDDSSDDTSSSGSSSSEEASSEEDSSSQETSESEASDTSSSGSDSDSDSGSDSSSDEDSAPEETTSKQSPTLSVTPHGEQKSSKLVQKNPMPPGQGKKSTRVRNVRRRNANRLNRFKEKGILPAGTTLAEFNKLEIYESTTEEDALAALEAVRSAEPEGHNVPKTATAAADELAFQARRQELLKSLASGGVEVHDGSTAKAPRSQFVVAEQVTAETTPTVEGHVTDTVNLHKDPEVNTTAFESVKPTSAPRTPLAEVANMGVNNSDVKPKEVSPSGATQPKPTTQVESAGSTTASARRAQLDVSASRRMLFGALGIKNPKTKQDEEKLRKDLMKDVRPLPSPKPAEQPGLASNYDVVDEDPEAWREKIIYRAVECCHEGIELSQPPFPFVQRWDPQQQGDRGGKRKKDLRDQSQYYEENPRAIKKQKQRKGKNKHSYAEQQEFLDGSYEPSYQEDSIITDFDEPSQIIPSDAEVEINSQLMGDLNEDGSAGASQGPADLAPLPDDITTLSDLTAGQANAGMTIAFKQLVMSEATKWQPQVSAYRTAVVIATPDNGELHLQLAQRDREQAEGNYDEETGERIYGKFDMPMDDEQDEDDGMRNLAFNELIEPKVVQNAPENLAINDRVEEAFQENDGPISDESRTLSHEKVSVEEQYSHVTETPLPSDGPRSPGRPAQSSNPPEQDIDTLRQESDFPQETPKHQLELSGQTSTVPELEAQLLNHELNSSVNDSSVPEPKAQLPVSGPDSSVDDSNMLEPEAQVQEQEPMSSVDEFNASGPEGQSSDQNLNLPVDNSNTRDQDLQLPEHPSNPRQKTANAAATPVTRAEQVQFMEAEVEPDLISDEARQKIFHMMKEAGFRSSVPSSVLKDIRPSGMESPGDAAVFEKLMRDMTEIENNSPSSPRFNGFGSSSPIRKSRQSTTSPKKSQHLMSSPAPLQSSWQTVESDEASSPVANLQEEESPKEFSGVVSEEDPDESWETIDPSPVKEKKRRSSLHKARPVPKAKPLWEQLAGLKKQRQVPGESLNVDNPKLSIEPPATLNGTDEQAGGINIQYPTISVGSSFTSVISDHGRQPDVVFDDNTLLDLDTPKAMTEDPSLLDQQDDVMTETEQEVPSADNVNASEQRNHLHEDSPGLPPPRWNDYPEDTPHKYRTLAEDKDTSEYGPEHSSLESVERSSQMSHQNTAVSQNADFFEDQPISPPKRQKKLPKASTESPAISEDPSSEEDDEDGLPSLKKVFAQSQASQRTIKQEIVPLPTKLPTKEDIEYQKAMEGLSDSNEDPTTPKVPQNRTRVRERTASQPIPKSRNSAGRDSKPRASESRMSQSQPAKPIDSSQMVDLTLSSEAEPEEVHEESSKISMRKKFRIHNLDDDDDEEFQDVTSRGWQVKKEWSERDARRLTSVTTDSFNKKDNRRKTVSRF